MKKRKTKAQLEQERQERVRRWLEREEQKEIRKREKLAEAALKKEAAKHREWFRKERSRPRNELPSEYPGESIYVHKRVLDAFTKQFGKKIGLESWKVVGGSGGRLVIEYSTVQGNCGKLELLDLGPMPTK